jgi:response regulator RpfG family c-di-GMP phosphodiesterase
MPGMTGDQFLARANELSPATRILITAFADIEAVISAVNGGKIYNYVRKPWDNDALLAIVDAAAEKFTLTAALQEEKQLLDCIMECSIDAIATSSTRSEPRVGTPRSSSCSPQWRRFATA